MYSLTRAFYSGPAWATRQQRPLQKMGDEPQPDSGAVRRPLRPGSHCSSEAPPRPSVSRRSRDASDPAAEAAAVGRGNLEVAATATRLRCSSQLRRGNQCLRARTGLLALLRPVPGASDGWDRPPPPPTGDRPRKPLRWQLRQAAAAAPSAAAPSYGISALDPYLAQQQHVLNHIFSTAAAAAAAAAAIFTAIVLP